MLVHPVEPGNILIIDDNKDICDLLSHLLEEAGYRTQLGFDGVTALKLLSQYEPDVLLLDTVIPEPNGMEVLAKAKLIYPQLPVIIITGNAGILGAVCAIKSGAWDYLPKPFDNKKVLELVNRAVQTRERKEHIYNKAVANFSTSIVKLMGNSQYTQKVISDIARVAHTDFTVVIEGETGTGKEMVAKRVHLSSQRASGPFIPIDCGAISGALIENELFGHEKGSFTGADQLSKGKFESANGGTLFLDEIANMSLSAQAKLLRVLQERVIYRVGGIKPISVNVRIIAASNENLMDAVVRGAFREDLYYRLNEFTIHIWPLRERPEDILFLADYFMTEVCMELSIESLILSAEVKKILLSHLWLGNVRELRAVIRRVALLSNGEIVPADVNSILDKRSTKLGKLGSSIPIKSVETIRKVSDYVARSCSKCIGVSDYKGLSLKEIKRINSAKTDQYIIEAVLRDTGNNKAEAARRLHIDYKSLCSKVKKIIKPEGK